MHLGSFIIFWSKDQKTEILGYANSLPLRHFWYIQNSWGWLVQQTVHLLDFNLWRNRECRLRLLVELLSIKCVGALQAFYSLPIMFGYPCKIQKKVKKNWLRVQVFLIEENISSRMWGDTLSTSKKFNLKHRFNWKHEITIACKSKESWTGV